MSVRIFRRKTLNFIIRRTVYALVVHAVRNRRERSIGTPFIDCSVNQDGAPVLTLTQRVFAPVDWPFGRK